MPTTRMKQQILDHIQQIADRDGFQILYACETGSRGWGFASPDSDFDIRFIYVHPRDRYLSVNNPQDSINSIFEDGGEVLDFNAWDLRKTLHHLRKSNATPFEWLQSPIIYQNHRRIVGVAALPVHQELLDLAPGYYAPRAGIHHYLNLTSSCYQEHLQSDLVKLKKYFYALRPILAARWIIEQGTFPPMVFDRLLELIVDRQDLRAEIDQLLTIKATANESTMIPVSPMLNNFIATEIENCRQAVKLIPNPNIDASSLDRLFQKYALNST